MLKLFSFTRRQTSQTDRSAERIERALLDRTRRLIIGIHVDAAYCQVSGALLIARGRGKSTRIEFMDGCCEQIPDSVKSGCRAAIEKGSQLNELQSSMCDLAEIQAVVVEALKRKAAKYVDRILAISVVDPGCWNTDFDGVPRYSSFCDANRLAEQTGISVIDSWPAGDIAVGGQGTPLEPMPLWLLHCDRSRKIARQVNVVVRVGETTSGYLIPPSDGVDIDVPRLTPITANGCGLIEGILRLAGIDPEDHDDTSRLLVSGIHDARLLERWKPISLESDVYLSRLIEIAESTDHRHLTTEQLLSTAMKWICDTCFETITGSLKLMDADYERNRESLTQRLAESRQMKVSRSRLLEAYDLSKPDFSGPGKIFIETRDSLASAFVAVFQNQFPDSVVTSLAGEQSGFATPKLSQIRYPSVIAAILGLLHIDQVPANLPAFTGAKQQRILGRLTPGRPNSWRSLLREMADYEPPSIKLRDAV